MLLLWELSLQLVTTITHVAAMEAAYKWHQFPWHFRVKCQGVMYWGECGAPSSFVCWEAGLAAD
jgi:hypothetical protein